MVRLAAVFEGLIMSVINRQLGIGLFSPRLGEAGNAVRGQVARTGPAGAVGLHAIDSVNAGSSFLGAPARAEGTRPAASSASVALGPRPIASAAAPAPPP
jgi:hypothetical protein